MSERKLNDDVSVGSELSGAQVMHKEAEEEIARAETRCVLYLRFVTFGFLTVVTIAVAVAIYGLLNGVEEAQLRSKFHDNADKVMEGFGTILENILMDVDAFAVTVTSQATALQQATGSNQSWPFVTIPNMAVRGSKLRALSKIFLLSMYHYVKHEDRDAWENYTRNHDAWVNQGIETQKSDPTFRGNIIEDWNTLGEINYYGSRAEDADFYVARWQSSPIVPRWDPYNWNAYQEPLIRHAMDPVLEEREVVMSTSYNVDDFAVYGLQDFVGDIDRATQPAVEIYSPVLKDSGEIVAHQDRRDAELVGILGLSVFWRDLLEGILPVGNDGLVAVFSNGCNQTFTFQVDGPGATYLGSGDRHDTDFDNLSAHSSLHDLLRFSAVHQVFTGAPLNQEFCPYKLSLYSSHEMANQFLTSAPLAFSLIAVFIFIFTSLVFLIYDYVIERRQKTVMLTATRSAAIVSSLFPKTFRARLEESAITSPPEEEHPRSRMQNFLASKRMQVDEKVDDDSSPIAEHFESSTVLFADIKGFTKWSAEREPTQVFVLLETLYGAYDVIAEKRGVYKIETIGDSYVAVCGVPLPNDDHAISMTKFALDIRRKTNELVKELAATLGEGTQKLQMRIGIHSGPVTAGVLRGQRARFQLFGDTVNTSSRMESCGEGNKIQVSQSTANILIAGGKEGWLSKREDVVVAKGKGAMQTYWVNAPAKAASSVNVSRSDNQNDTSILESNSFVAGGLSSSFLAL